MKKLLFPIFITLFLVSVVAGQSTVDTVILATDVNFPDAELARAASYSEGTPVLLTAKESLSAEAKASLDELKPTNVVVVGGPEVVSDAVVAELETLGYTVTRVWGTTATGTAAEAAEYFNPEGASSAVLVLEDSVDDPSSESEEVLIEVTSQTEGEPILLVSSDGVSAVTADALVDLGVEQVTIVGDLSAEAEQKLEADLGDLKVKIKEKIKGKKAEIKAKFKAKLEKKLKASDTLLVVAAANFGHRLAVPVLTGHHVFHVGEEAQIQELVDLVIAKNISSVKVVGKPDLAQKIVDALKATTATVTQTTADEARKAFSDLLKEKRDKLKERFDEQKKKLKAKRDAAKARMKEKANQLRERLNNLETKPDGLQTVLDQAKALIESNPHEALKVLRKAVHLVKRANFEKAKADGTVDQEVEDETEDVDDEVQDIEDENEEFGGELKKLDGKKRIEALREFKLEPREKKKELIKRAEKEHAQVERLKELRKEKLEKLKERKEKIGKVRERVEEKRDKLKDKRDKKSSSDTSSSN